MHIPHIARFLIGAPFVVAGIFKIFGFAQTQAFMDSAGLPAAALLLVLTIIIEILGGLAVIFNKHVHYGAWALIIFTIIATLVFHNQLSDQTQMNIFMKNLAWIGGLLLVLHMSKKS